MQPESYPSNAVTVNPPLLLSAWSTTTTLNTWMQYPAEIRHRTQSAARHLPYKDTPRSRWEAQAARVIKPSKKVSGGAQ